MVVCVYVHSAGCFAPVENGLEGTSFFKKERRFFVASACLCFNFHQLVCIHMGCESRLLLEASLGYYINPLVSVLLGILFLKERLNRLQVVAVSIAAAAVIISAFQYGSIPYIALLLAFSFGLYGLCKKEQVFRAQSV